MEKYVFLILAIILVVFGFGFWSRRQERRALLARPLSADERAIVLDQVPLIEKLPAALRAPLEGKINLFLHQVEFIGCNGLEVTEEMRLSVAARACLLIANKDSWYKNLRTVLLYPDAFKSRRIERTGMIETARETVRLGESWARGPVILSWAHSEHGAFVDDDGHDVVIHEFAHQLDDLSGYTDGAPILAKGHSLWDWERVFTQGLARLRAALEAGEATVIDPYGATAPVEYFAVTVELFFERPADLHAVEPEVYAHLAEFFELDPMEW